MTVYVPTVIKTRPPERVIRPGLWRPENLLTQSQLPSGVSACRDLDQDIAQAMVGHNPRGYEWHNSRKGGTHGTISGESVGSLMYFDDAINRYAVNMYKGATSRTITYENTLSHPLYNNSGAAISCWLYLEDTALEQRVLSLNRGTAPALILGTDSAVAGRFRVYIYWAVTNIVDAYTVQSHPTNEWFRLHFAWNGGNNIGLSFNDTDCTFTVRAATTPTTILGSGGDQAARTSGIHGRIADLIVWDKHVTQAAQKAWFGDEEDASLSGYVRGVDFQPQQPHTNWNCMLPRAIENDEPFVANDDTKLIENLWAYWPMESRTHLPDYGPNGWSLKYVSTGYQMNQVSWYRNAHGSRAYGTGHHYRATDWGDIWPTSEVTISLWVNNSATITSSALGNFTYTLAERCNLHAAWSDGKIYWDWGGFTAGTSRIVGTPPTNYLLREWRHVLVYAKAGVGMGIWLDGKELASHTSGSTPTRSTGTQGDTTLMTGAGYRYEGSIAEVIVWDRLLDNSEKVELYRNPLVMRKYIRTGTTGSSSIWLPPVPAAPISNARTAYPRVSQLQVTQPGDDGPVLQPKERFTVNQYHRLATKLKCWFAPVSSQAGQRLIDHNRLTPPMTHIATADYVQDPKFGTVMDFTAADSDRYTAESFTTNEIGYVYNEGWMCELLVNPDTVSGTQYLLAHGNINTTVTPVLNFALRTENQQLRFIYRNSINTAWIYSTTDNNVLTAGSWAHVIFWHNGTSAWGWYVNGVAEPKTDTGSLLGAAQVSNIPLKFGTRYDAGLGTHGSFYDGKIAYVRIWKGEWMSATEAYELYKQIVLQGRDPLKKRIIDGPTPAVIPGRHWVGEDGDWFTARNWSRSRGGKRGAGVPGCDNPVLFDAERPEYPER